MTGDIVDEAKQFLDESTWSSSPVALGGIVLLELLLMFYGQRYLYGHISSAARSRLLTYAIVMPGTVLHELGHFLMCKLLLVPVGDDLRLANGKRGKVHWFWPERQPDGSMVLGYVQHQTTDAFRNSLIAIAPVILVPALLVGWCVLLLGTGVFADPFSAFRDAGIFSKVATIAAVVLGSRAAFPSPGDHVGALGAVFLLALTGGGVYAIYRADELVAALRVLAVVLAAPAAGVVINRVLLVPILSRSRN